MGLGTCLIGFAVAALRQEPGLKRQLGLPGDETVYAVIALGYPAESYLHPAGRRPVSPQAWRSRASSFHRYPAVAGGRLDSAITMRPLATATEGNAGRRLSCG
jgi:hypothetical protein